MAILGTELTVGAIGFVAALLVALFSWRVARMTGKRRYNYFALAFLLASISAGILAWFAYKGISVTQLLPVDSAPTGPVAVLVAALLLTIVSYLLIFLMLERVDNWLVVLVLLVFAITALLTSKRVLISYFWLGAMLLAMITYRFITRYQEARSKTSLFLALAFIFLLVGAVANLFTTVSPNYYIAGSVARIIGYVLLAASMMSIYSVGESPRARATYRMRDIS